MRALPEQKPREALLTRGPNDQVGIGLPPRVEMLGDVFDVKDGSKLVQTRAFDGVLGEEGTYRVDYLAATAVPHGDVHQQAIDIGRRVSRLLEHHGGGFRKQIESSYRVNPPAAFRGQTLDRVLNNANQRDGLADRAVKVVGRQQPEGDHFNPGVITPPEKLANFLGTHTMPRRRGPTLLGSPSSVAVEDDSDMAGNALNGNVTGNLP